MTTSSVMIEILKKKRVLARYKLSTINLKNLKSIRSKFLRIELRSEKKMITSFLSESETIDPG